jgi:hypothetical protein
MAWFSNRARAWTLLLPLCGGCLFGTGNGGASGDVGYDAGAEVDALVECRGDASDAEVADAIAITDEYAQSLHEMVACGQLAVVLCAGVVDGVIDAIVEQSEDATPDGWYYGGDGVWRTGADGTRMEMKFYFAEDLQVGRAGEPVVHDLFHTDSYLVDATAVLDWTTGEVAIHYASPGPLVELLGFGTSPPNPLPIDLNDLAAIKSKLRALQFDASIDVDDVRPFATIRYHIDTPRMPASALLDGDGMIYALEYADGFREHPPQELVVDAWDVAFVDDGYGGVLDGAISFVVEGELPYAGTMSFLHSKYATRELQCR